MSELITEIKLRQLAGEWIDGGRRVVGPVRIKDRVLYRPLASPEALLIESTAETSRPANSIKEFFFPKQETLYQYPGRNIELIEPAQEFSEQLILAARPCDAAALPILDHVFNWDFADDFYNRRRAATTIVTMPVPRRTNPASAPLSALLRTPHAAAMRFSSLSAAAVTRCAASPIKAEHCSWRRQNRQRNRGKPRRLPNRSLIPARFELLSTATRRPALGRARTHLHGVRRLRLLLSDVPLLRYCRRRTGGGERSRQDLGHVPVPDFHASRFRTQSESAATGAAAATHFAQVFHLSRKVRRDPLHRLR